MKPMFSTKDRYIFLDQIGSSLQNILSWLHELGALILTGSTMVGHLMACQYEDLSPLCWHAFKCPTMVDPVILAVKQFDPLLYKLLINKYIVTLSGCCHFLLFPSCKCRGSSCYYLGGCVCILMQLCNQAFYFVRARERPCIYQLCCTGIYRIQGILWVQFH